MNLLIFWHIYFQLASFFSPWTRDWQWVSIWQIRSTRPCSCNNSLRLSKDSVCLIKFTEPNQIFLTPYRSYSLCAVIFVVVFDIATLSSCAMFPTISKGHCCIALYMCLFVCNHGYFSIMNSYRRKGGGPTFFSSSSAGISMSFFPPFCSRPNLSQPLATCPFAGQCRSLAKKSFALHCYFADYRNRVHLKSQEKRARE